MHRKREERLKSHGAHHFLFSPQTSEERGERSDLIIFFQFYPYIQISHCHSCFIMVLVNSNVDAHVEEKLNVEQGCR